jgi:hypothetical protein
MIHTQVTPAEQADPLAIRELIDAHLFTEGNQRKLMLAFLRYGDTFVKIDHAWLLAERNRYVDWIETRSSHP